MEHAHPDQFANSKKNFGIWILGQIKRDDAVGELARIAFSDRRFPRDGDYKAISKYLNSVSASTEMHDALDEAETDWLAL